MITLTIKIKEDEKEDILNGTGVNVDIHEVAIKYTDAEMEVSKVLKDRIKVNEKLQYIRKNQKKIL